MQVLTVYRIDTDWAFRDVTGEAYGRSPDIRNTYDSAQQMARRIGAHIDFSREAEVHYRAVIAAPFATQLVDTAPRPAPNSPGRFRAFVARFVRRRRRENENLR